jgi:hypothetical protein
MDGVGTMERTDGVEGVDRSAGAAKVERIAERVGQVLLWVSSLILGAGYLLVWTTDIEEESHDRPEATAGSADAGPGVGLAGLEKLHLPESLEPVGAPIPTVRLVFPDVSDGWLALFEVEGNPLRAWDELGEGLAGGYELPAVHAACEWLVDGAAPVELTGRGAPEGTEALRCRADAVDVAVAEPTVPRELEVAMWSNDRSAYLGLAFQEVAVVVDENDPREVPIGPAATPADLADVPFPRERPEQPEEVAGPGDPFPAPLRCLDGARLPDGARLVALVVTPVLPVSSVAVTEPGQLPVAGPSTAIGVLEADNRLAVLESLAAQIEDAEVVTRLSESGRSIRFVTATDSDGGYCEVRETDDPSLLMVLHRA